MTRRRPDPILTPDPDPQRRRWWRLRVPLGPLAAAYVLIIAVAAWGFQQQHEADLERCKDQAASRIVLRQLVELTDDGGGRLPLTQVPGYDALDPPMQQYLANLEAATTPPEPTPGEDPPPTQRERFVDRALALIDVPDCSRLE